MRPPLVIAAAAAFLGLAVFGFGHAIGAWEAPAPSEPPAAAEPAASTRDEATKQKKKARNGRDKQGRARPAETALPAAVVARLDALCRRSRVDAERVARGPQPTSARALRRFFERLGRLSERYNVEALELLRPHAGDPGVRALARLFAREKRLFARLLDATAALGSPTGRARFENRLAELRVVGLDEADALVALGARSCAALAG